MPQRAFVPVPLIEAEPRVFKSFRGRQMRGLLFGVGGAALSALVFGVRYMPGYVLTFLAALPGFAYGYYQYQGKPVEYWLWVLWRYYTEPQVVAAIPQDPWTRLKAALAVFRTALHAALRSVGKGHGAK